MQTATLRLVFLMALILAGTASAAGPWRAHDRNTSGWEFMTPRERIEHQATVRAFTSYDACHAYQLGHHQLMEARAKASGQTLKPERRDICERLRSLQSQP